MEKSDRQILLDDIQVFMNELHDPDFVRSWINFYQERLTPVDTTRDGMVPMPRFYYRSVTMNQANRMYLLGLKIRLQQLEPETYGEDFIDDSVELDWVDDDDQQINRVSSSSNDAAATESPAVSATPESEANDKAENVEEVAAQPESWSRRKAFEGSPRASSAPPRLPLHTAITSDVEPKANVAVFKSGLMDNCSGDDADSAQTAHDSGCGSDRGCLFEIEDVEPSAE